MNVDFNLAVQLLIESALKNSPLKHMHENTEQRSNRLITEQQSNPAMNFLTMGKLFFLYDRRMNGR